MQKDRIPYYLKILGVMFLLVITVLIRFYNIEALGLSNWDEGEFTIAGRELANNSFDYKQFRPQGSPLYQLLLGVLFKLLGARDTVALLSSAFFGVLTVVFVFLLAYKLFDYEIALASGFLLATTEYHIVFSRMALAESLFTLLYVTALLFFYLGYVNSKLTHFLIAAVLTALGLNTKYNGLLAIITFWVFFVCKLSLDFIGGQRSSLKRDYIVSLLKKNRTVLLSFPLSILILIFFYLPWLIILIKIKGYETINTSIASKVSLANINSYHFLFIYKCFIYGVAPSLLIAGIIGYLYSFRTKEANFLVIWIILLLGMSLLYHPYHRLLLPAVPPVVILGALGIKKVASKITPRAKTARLIFFSICFLIIFHNFANSLDSLRKETKGYQRLAEYLDKELKRTKVVALRASNGQYLVAEGSGGGLVYANRNAIGPWEKFELTDLGNNKIALRASNGQYLVADGGGGGLVYANRNAIGPWEKFELIDLGNNKIALRASNGQYLVADGGGGGLVYANRNSIDPWGKFELTESERTWWYVFARLQYNSFFYLKGGIDYLGALPEREDIWQNDFPKYIIWDMSILYDSVASKVLSDYMGRIEIIKYIENDMYDQNLLDIRIAIFDEYKKNPTDKNFDIYHKIFVGRIR